MADGKKYNRCFQVICANAFPEDERYKRFRKDWEDYGSSLCESNAPLQVDIELTNACNLKCPMCERNMMTRSVGFMDYALFKRIIDQCAELGVCSVKLNLWGESFLHRDLFKMVDYAKRQNIYTQFNSNATLLTGRNAQRLLTSGLDRITFSIEGGMREAYERTRKGAEFEATMKSVEDFIALKPIGHKPLLTLQFMMMKSNSKYIPAFVNRFKDKVDFISVTNVNAASGDRKILAESMVDYSSFPKKPCSEMWQRLSVFWNGEVTVCCNDYNGSLKIGNVYDSSLMELWHCEKLSLLRARHKKLDFSDLICNTCTANHRLS
ncbi:MAG: radical SAM protein [Candidatus Omnitrophota bacterium]